MDASSSCTRRSRHPGSRLLGAVLACLVAASPLAASLPSDTTDVEGAATAPPGWQLTPEAGLYADGLRLLRGSDHAAWPCRRSARWA